MEEAGCILVSLLIAAVITGILAIAKVAIPLAMAWGWVFLPLLIWVALVGGVFIFDGGDFC